MIGDKNSAAGKERWSSYAVDEDDGNSLDTDDSHSPLDDHELESAETAEEGLEKKRKKHLRYDGKGDWDVFGTC